LVGRGDLTRSAHGVNGHVDCAGPGRSGGFDYFVEQSFAGRVDEDFVRAEGNADQPKTVFRFAVASRFNAVFGTSDRWVPCE
jgi:hypothetical protein